MELGTNEDPHSSRGYVKRRGGKWTSRVHDLGDLLLTCSGPHLLKQVLCCTGLIVVSFCVRVFYCVLRRMIESCPGGDGNGMRARYKLPIFLGYYAYHWKVSDRMLINDLGS